MRRLLLLSLSVVLLACTTGGTPSSPLVGSPLASPTPQMQPTVQHPEDLLERAALDPEAFLGQEVTVEGILEAEGSMPDVRFFLRSVQGHRLEVGTWAPIEVAQPPSGGKAPRTMASYVGHHLLLTGVIERQADQVLLQVTQAEEL